MRKDNLVDFYVVDEDNNLTFIVDVEGYRYLLGRDIEKVPDVPSITVSGVIVTISGIDIFNNVVVSGINVTISGQELIYEEMYVQGANLSNFPNTNSYHLIPDTTYIVDSDKTLHITSLVAVQSKKGLSTIALYRDSIREREIPILEDTYVVFSKPIKYYEGEEFQVRFKPKDKKTRFQIFVDGYITNHL